MPRTLPRALSLLLVVLAAAPSADAFDMVDIATIDSPNNRLRTRDVFFIMKLFPFSKNMETGPRKRHGHNMRH